MVHGRGEVCWAAVCTGDGDWVGMEEQQIEIPGLILETSLEQWP